MSEGVGVNKTSASKECVNSHNWHFLNKAFGFPSTVFNGCHDVFRMSVEIDSIVF